MKKKTLILLDLVIKIRPSTANDFAFYSSHSKKIESFLFISSFMLAKKENLQSVKIEFMDVKGVQQLKNSPETVKVYLSVTNKTLTDTERFECLSDFYDTLMLHGVSLIPPCPHSAITFRVRGLEYFSGDTF
jgi:hypothetical protein